MIKSLCIEPSGVHLKKFKAEVDVVARHSQTDNILIKTWNKIYKEFSFSEDKGCWVHVKEFNEYPKSEERWHRLVL
jgi:hypothetical protein